MHEPSRRRKLTATAVLWACVALMVVVPAARPGDLDHGVLYLAVAAAAGAAALTLVIWRARS